MISGKDRRKALLELARVQDTKGTGNPSSPTDPIAAQPLSVAPTEGAGPERKRKRLVKAFASSAAATAAAVLAPSTEEESSGSPLIPRRRKLPAIEGTSSLQPGEIEVVEVEESSAPLPSAQPAPAPTDLPSPRQTPSSPPVGQPLGRPALPAGGVSALPEGPPPPLPTPVATTEHGGASSRPSASGASHENLSKVICLGSTAHQQPGAC